MNSTKSINLQKRAHSALVWQICAAAALTVFAHDALASYGKTCKQGQTVTFYNWCPTNGCNKIIDNYGYCGIVGVSCPNGPGTGTIQVLEGTCVIGPACGGWCCTSPWVQVDFFTYTCEC